MPDPVTLLVTTWVQHIGAAYPKEEQTRNKADRQQSFSHGQLRSFSDLVISCP